METLFQNKNFKISLHNEQFASVTFLQPIEDMYNKDYFTRNYIASQEKRKWIYKKLADLILCDKIERVLDIGAGAGLFLKEVPVPCKYGIEPSPEACKLAAENTDAEILNVDPLSLPDDWHTDFFDVITILDVLAHTDYPNKLIEWSKKRLRTNGRLIIKTPNHSPEFYRYAVKKYEKNEQVLKMLLHIPYQKFGWGEDGLLNILRINGFSNIKIYPFEEFEKPYPFAYSDLWHPRRFLYKRLLRDAAEIQKFPSILAVTEKY